MDHQVPTDNDIKSYIGQMTVQELIVLEIAKSHLASSFDIVRSIGFIEWFAKASTTAVLKE